MAYRIQKRKKTEFYNGEVIEYINYYIQEVFIFMWSDIIEDSRLQNSLCFSKLEDAKNWINRHTEHTQVLETIY